MRNVYFVCYDVSDPQRLARTYKKMQGYGDPVQYSVFACNLSAKEVVYMKEDLGRILNLDEDRVIIIDSGSADRSGGRVSTMGVQRSFADEDSAIVI